jgi:TPR repeat protein
MVSEVLNFYREANDFGSCVRLFCAVGDVANASKIALTTSDPAACFNLARYYEGENNIGEAIVHYSKSGRLQHAIILAKENGYDQQVMTMSLMSSKQVMI